ncbi:hypothetical protein BJX76DRAFT_269336 [Aspergillus varians]
MYQLLVTVWVALCALIVSGAPTVDVNNGITWDPNLSWEIEPSPGAPPITLNGTVETVYAKLKEINPNYDEDWKDVKKREAEQGSSILDKRIAHDVECFFRPHYGVHDKTVLKNIEKLRDVTGTVELPGGPNRCARVSCVDKGAIFWCNDDSKKLPSYNNLADGVMIILDHCKGRIDPNSGKKFAAGQLNHNDKWRVGLITDDWECHDGAPSSGFDSGIPGIPM